MMIYEQQVAGSFYLTCHPLSRALYRITAEINITEPNHQNIATHVERNHAGAETRPKRDVEEKKNSTRMWIHKIETKSEDPTKKRCSDENTQRNKDGRCNSSAWFTWPVRKRKIFFDWSRCNRRACKYRGSSDSRPQDANVYAGQHQGTRTSFQSSVASIQPSKKKKKTEHILNREKNEYKGLSVEKSSKGLHKKHENEKEK